MGSDISDHLITLYMLTVQLRLNTIVELGTRFGNSTVALLCAAKEIDGRVYSIDHYECLETHAMVKSYNLDRYWTFIHSDNLEAEWYSWIDHLFIDADHTKEHVLLELTKYEPFVINGGIITLHDSNASPENHWEVREAVEDYFKGRTDVKIYEYLHNFGLLVIFKQ